MAKVTSPASGQPYGIRRVCQAWGVPRSSFYAAQVPAPESAVTAAAPARRGPKPAITDEALLAAIKRDLQISPWTGEGHRKVWARLRARWHPRLPQAAPARDAGERPARAPPSVPHREHVWNLGARPAIPPKINEAVVACPAPISANRNRVERLWARLKQWRAVATRYEKTAASFLGVLCLAATTDWLRR